MTSKAIAKREPVTDTALAHGASSLPPGTKLQRIETPFHTAIEVQKSRNIEVVERRALEEARLMGEDFYYAWDVNDKNAESGRSRVDGVSIDGAMVLLRHWGNAVCLPRLVEVTSEHYLFEASFVDLEQGMTSVRLYRQHRSVPPGRYDKQQWEDLEFSKGQSKAIRNAIVSALPNWLVDRCKQEAIKAVTEELAGIDPDKERKALLKRASGARVTKAEIERKFQKKYGEFDASDLTTLRALLRTVEEGYATASDLFGPPPVAESKPTQTAPSMAPPVAGERVVDKFARRIRGCWSEADLVEVGKLVAEAKAAGTITEDEALALKEIYGEVLGPFRRHPSKQQEQEREPGDDG